ncbi:MAG: CoB--CoM heterodisulfide reductase iron-sulfur subunit B family protein [Clostridiales Family XIII bacterium]|jgi:heterodisulfide reductase subunit B|nr:CoB--CoM heterodisulfide reductase iron-sulfur subunit B family protein [Clostridiales Family XIII bacterium]
MIRYSYFPGCATESTAKSTRLANDFVFDRIGIDLVEIKDWNCCGATSAHVLSEALGLSLPARSLARAEADHPDLDIVSGCASCYARLKLANFKVRSDKGTRYMAEKVVGRPYEAKREVYNFLDILSSEEALRGIEAAILRKFARLNVACYYGCLNIRPAEVTGAKDRENPLMMDEIAKLTGAVPVEWGFKTECCGAAHQNDAAREARPLVWRILDNARENGADMVLTACPMCNMNLEMRQGEYVKKRGGKTIPVLSITELLAIAMGAGGERIAIDTHHVPVMRIVAKALRGAESEAAI